MFPSDQYEGYSDGSRYGELGYSDSDGSNSYESFERQRRNEGSFNRMPVQQPYQPNFQNVEVNNQRNQEYLNEETDNPNDTPIYTCPEQKNYHETWKKNINLEEDEKNKEKSKYVEVDRFSVSCSSSHEVVFEKDFLTQKDAEKFLKIARDLARVKIGQINQTCQGKVIEVKSKLENNPKKCQIQVEFYKDEEFQDFLGSPNPPFKIEEDKLGFSYQMNCNLEKLRINQKHEEIFIRKAKPEKTQHMDPKTPDLLKQYVEENSELNNDQKDAILDCLTIKNYNLVLGMPGTGKTHVIVILLKIFIHLEKKILVTSHTHSAVDNILKRFVKDYPEDKEKVVRFGYKASIDPEIVNLDLAYNPPEKRAYNNGNNYFDEDEDEEDLLSSKQIFAVTCLGVGNKALKYRTFDICIVDEASQIVEPILIGPLLKTDRFILFGDHNQMPPLVISDEAKKSGMEVSLFEKLAIEHQGSISYLTIQYRMNEKIMRFSNSAVYKNRMTCGTDDVGKGTIPLTLTTIRKDISWIPNIFDPKRSVVFLDLTVVKFLYHEVGRNLNCLLTCFIARQLVAEGIESKDIGIISPLKSDKVQVNSELKNLPKLNRFTIDTCQGIDKSCIIMNLSLNFHRVKFLLEKKKRVNVAFTRAKHKLIIIGSFHDLKDLEGIGDFLSQLNRDSEIEILDCKMLLEAGVIKRNWLNY